MPLTIADIDRWDAGDVREIFHIATDMAQTHADAANGLATLPVFDNWGGETAEAAKQSGDRIIIDLNSLEQSARAVAVAASVAATEIDRLKADLHTLRLKLAADKLTLDPISGIVRADQQGTSGSIEQLIRIKQYQRSVDALITRANGIDHTLADAIDRATGRVPPPMPGSLSSTMDTVDPEPVGPAISPERAAALTYAEQWARDANPAYQNFGVGNECTNFVSQALRAGGFADVDSGDPTDVRGTSGEWFYRDEPSWAHPQSTTWTLARESHNFWTQQSGRGQITAVVPLPTNKAALDPLAASHAGLVPGDLIYYKDNTGSIEHVAMYAGVKSVNGVPTDVVYQHALPENSYRNDWMPDTADFYGGPAQAEFVHLRYPGEP